MKVKVRGLFRICIAVCAAILALMSAPASSGEFYSSAPAAPEDLKLLNSQIRNIASFHVINTRSLVNDNGELALDLNRRPRQ